MTWPNSIVTVGVLLDQGQVLLGADHRAGVARKSHDRKDAEDGVDCAAFETKVSEVCAIEKGAARLEELSGGAPAIDVRLTSLRVVTIRATAGRWLFPSRLEL
jgi:hypothetical protein